MPVVNPPMSRSRDAEHEWCCLGVAAYLIGVLLGLFVLFFTPLVPCMRSDYAEEFYCGVITSLVLLAFGAVTAGIGILVLSGLKRRIILRIHPG